MLTPFTVTSPYCVPKMPVKSPDFNTCAKAVWPAVAVSLLASVNVAVLVTSTDPAVTLSMLTLTIALTFARMLVCKVKMNCNTITTITTCFDLVWLKCTVMHAALAVT